MVNTLNYDVGPDNLFYLVGAITEFDLSARNACGFASLEQASATASKYGYKLSWEA